MKRGPGHQGSWVTITDPKRAPDVERVFGSTTVPVLERFPIPALTKLPIGEHRCYQLDIDALSDEQRERLIEFSIERYGMTREECEAELPHGFPIVADSCIFVTDGMDFL